MFWRPALPLARLSLPTPALPTAVLPTAVLPTPALPTTTRSRSLCCYRAPFALGAWG